MKHPVERNHYLDNLRSFLIYLVIIHHLAISYGPPMFWFYQERSTNLYIQGLLGLFVSVNQSYFLGLLFLISGYFTSYSYIHHTPKEVFLRRLKKLCPSIFLYLFIINPLIMYPYLTLIKNLHIPFVNFLKDYYTQLRYFSIGPLWFLELLLFFTFTFIFMYKLPVFSKRIHLKISNSTIVVFFLTLAMTTFLTRIFFSIGKDVFGIQISYLPQYFILFTIGFLSYNNNWLKVIPKKITKFSLPIIIICITSWPIIMLKGGALNDFSSFRGNFTLQNFTYSYWETICSLGMIIFLINLFQKKFNFTNKFLTLLSQTSFTAFVLHIPIVIILEYSIRSFPILPLYKFFLLSPTSVFLTFISAVYFKNMVSSIGKK